MPLQVFSNVQSLNVSVHVQQCLSACVQKYSLVILMSPSMSGKVQQCVRCCHRLSISLQCIMGILLVHALS